MVEKPERVRPIANSIAVFVLGILVPAIVLAGAYSGLTRLSGFVGQDVKPGVALASFAAAQPHLHSDNDYALFSVLSAEHANETVMANKQVMKTVVMQIGFAVISLGMMLITLGINAGGATATGEVSGMKFDFKTGSTGVLVFVTGAAMAAAGGLLKNDYTTVPIPSFGAGSGDSEVVRQYFDDCKAKAGTAYAACFANTYEHYIVGGEK